MAALKKMAQVKTEAASTTSSDNEKNSTIVSQTIEPVSPLKVTKPKKINRVSGKTASLMGDSTFKAGRKAALTYSIHPEKNVIVRVNRTLLAVAANTFETWEQSKIPVLPAVQQLGPYTVSCSPMVKFLHRATGRVSYIEPSVMVKGVRAIQDTIAAEEAEKEQA